MEWPWASNGEASSFRHFDQNLPPSYQPYSQVNRYGYTAQEMGGQVTAQGNSKFNDDRVSDTNGDDNSVNESISSRGSDRFWCEVQGCTDDKGFTRKRDLGRHIEAIHQGFRRFHCGCCMNAGGTYSSSRKDHIKQHIRKKHKKSGVVQWCNVNDCDAVVQLGFSSNRCLAEHVYGYHYGNSNPAILAPRKPPVPGVTYTV